MATVETSQSRSVMYANERENLIGALGKLTEGGILEDVQHIGATSVWNEEAHACLDIGLSIWPFPLAPSHLTALHVLGYVPVAEKENAGDVGTTNDTDKKQRFRHEFKPVHLFFVESGNELWTDYQLLRDYLRADEEARNKYAHHKRTLAALCRFDPEAYRVTRSRFFAESLHSARQWWITHIGFTALKTVLREMEGVSCEWHVAGGWAIDLFLGRVTRVHHDTDILISRDDQLVWQEALSKRGWQWVAPCEGKLEPWLPNRRLEPLHIQAHAHRDGQFIDFLFGDVAGGIWRFRRNQSIVRTCERLYLTSEDGIPFLAPEAPLLYKSKPGADGWRDKDIEDFEKIRPLLDPERRAWLQWALTVTNAEHPWLTYLESSVAETSGKVVLPF